MLQNYRRLKRWEETDDICQTAMIRLSRALSSRLLPLLENFYRLATLQIRRELIDMSRRYYGPEGEGIANHATNASRENSQGEDMPAYDWRSRPTARANWSPGANSTSRSNAYRKKSEKSSI